MTSNLSVHVGCSNARVFDIKVEFLSKDMFKYLALIARNLLLLFLRMLLFGVSLPLRNIIGINMSNIDGFAKLLILKLHFSKVIWTKAFILNGLMKSQISVLNLLLKMSRTHASYLRKPCTVRCRLHDKFSRSWQRILISLVWNKAKWTHLCFS